MTNEFNFLGDFAAQSKQLLEPVVEFNAVTARAMTALSTQTAGLVADAFDFGTSRLQASVQVENLTDLADDQRRSVTDFGAKMKDHVDTALQTVAEAQKAYGDVFAGAVKANSELAEAVSKTAA